MPELPEVETMVRGLRPKALGRRINKIWYNFPPQIAIFVKKSSLKGKKLNSINRRGKLVILSLDGDLVIMIHPGMTGRIYIGKTFEKSPYLRLKLKLDDGQSIVLYDVRKFARIFIGPKAKILELPYLKSLGPEPLGASFRLEDLKNILSSAGRKIKQILLDQKKIAGIGNIYADEILWYARIHPESRGYDLKASQIKNLHRAIKNVLRRGIELEGTSIRNYLNASGQRGRYGDIRVVYGREGEPCLKCQTPIRRRVIAGRSAHFCPRCQKLAY